ncbi:putative toxin-antitoxin system toxin component, PIN family [Pelomonas sp. P7]|uniref:Toxin-antitoxin system toxin component, PIN family n=1 Tax=Pelomonas caseinilytica TaxID=2906763 RepID=A0ABS8XHG1_9BURK|nr:putative toxin-antitoxin system toxin component, PIN family [Pelomonas sp. P7]MCE4537989.1 putative toxin-antitoxin system toxin component, PIN family [Pelomonas sp. P7]
MKRRPRWVVDTNVVVSALLWRGTPGRLIELAVEEQAVQLFTSRALLAELAATLVKKKLTKYVAATGMTADQLLANYRLVATTVAVRNLDVRVSRDVDDDDVLACAMAAHADLIVSGDEDLLVLKAFAGVPIVTVAQAIKSRQSG